jgi:hypothetical protein
VGLVTVSSILIYELFDVEDCGFSDGVDNDSASNDDGDDDCCDKGFSDDSVNDVNIDGTFSKDGGDTGVRDTKGNREEGSGDEDDINFDGEVDENKCVDFIVVDDGEDDGIDDDDDSNDDNDGGGANDDGNGEDGANDEIGDNDDICDDVAEECKDGRLL